MISTLKYDINKKLAILNAVTFNLNLIKKKNIQKKWANIVNSGLLEIQELQQQISGVGTNQLNPHNPYSINGLNNLYSNPQSNLNIYNPLNYSQSYPTEFPKTFNPLNQTFQNTFNNYNGLNNNTTINNFNIINYPSSGISNSSKINLGNGNIQGNTRYFVNNMFNNSLFESKFNDSMNFNNDSKFNIGVNDTCENPSNSHFQLNSSHFINESNYLDNTLNVNNSLSSNYYQNNYHNLRKSYGIDQSKIFPKISTNNPMEMSYTNNTNTNGNIFTNKPNCNSTLGNYSSQINQSIYGTLPYNNKNTWNSNKNSNTYK